MKKNVSILLSIFALCLITGCSKTPELSYSGDELLYTCTDEQVSLFKEDVNVNITDKQSFAYFDNNSEMKEFTDGLLEFNEENRPEISRCYFVKRDEITGNEFSSKSNIAFKDSAEGSMKLKITGTYSYKIVDSKTFIENYTTTNKLTNAIYTQINAIFIANMGSKTYAELSNEKEFDVERLNALNSTITSKYGIEVTKVNINLEKN